MEDDAPVIYGLEFQVSESEGQGKVGRCRSCLRKGDGREIGNG